MELTTQVFEVVSAFRLFMMSKIQNLNGTHNVLSVVDMYKKLFMMSKIQNLNGTHNYTFLANIRLSVVYDVKDTKFEWNSQPNIFKQNSRQSCL